MALRFHLKKTVDVSGLWFNAVIPERYFTLVMDGIHKQCSHLSSQVHSNKTGQLNNLYLTIYRISRGQCSWSPFTEYELSS